MLYEPPKTKKYIIIFGAIAAVLAVLVIVAMPLMFKRKTNQTPIHPPLTSRQQKILEEQNRMIEATKKQPGFVLSPEAIKKDADRLIEEAKANGYGKSPEEIRKEQDALINSSKK